MEILVAVILFILLEEGIRFVIDKTVFANKKTVGDYSLSLHDRKAIKNSNMTVRRLEKDNI